MVDAARAEMLIQANTLAAGATMRIAPQWLKDHAAAPAKPDCPHMFDDEVTVPVLHYPFSGTVRCGLCPLVPEPFCLLCGAPVVDEDGGFGAVSGLQVVVFALCPAHKPELTASTLG